MNRKQRLEAQHFGHREGVGLYVERVARFWRPWQWEVTHSSGGEPITGRAWTHTGAEALGRIARALRIAGNRETT